MRDVVLLCAFLAFIPIALSSTFGAYLIWGWAGLLAPGMYVYGFMLSVPFVQIFALISLVSLLIAKDPQRVPFELNRTSLLFLLFSFHALLVALFAFEGLARNWEMFQNIVKTVLFCLLMPMLASSRLRVHALLLMVVLGLAFHGLLDGLKFVMSGGGHTARGIAKFGDNNYEAMALATTIPLLLYAARYSVNVWVKRGFAIVMAINVLAIVSTNSRGGLLTLLAIAVVMIGRTKRKMAGLVTLVFIGAIAIALAPASWSERMNTMKEAGGDESFMTRVAAWKKSTAIALDYPIVGGGFYAVQSPPTFHRYRTSPGLMGFIDTPDPGGFAAHSIYFQVIGDMGYVGFIIYMALLMNVFALRRSIKKIAKSMGPSADWALHLADALSVSMVAFMVGGALLSAAYLEIPFILMALMGVTHQVIKSKQTSEMR